MQSRSFLSINHNSKLIGEIKINSQVHTLSHMNWYPRIQVPPLFTCIRHNQDTYHLYQKYMRAQPLTSGTVSAQISHISLKVRPMRPTICLGDFIQSIERNIYHNILVFHFMDFPIISKFLSSGWQVVRSVENQQLSFCEGDALWKMTTSGQGSRENTAVESVLIREFELHNSEKLS